MLCLRAPNLGPRAPNLGPRAHNCGLRAPHLMLCQNPQSWPHCIAPIFGPKASNPFAGAPNIGPRAPVRGPGAPNLSPRIPSLGPEPTIWAPEAQEDIFIIVFVGKSHHSESIVPPLKKSVLKRFYRYCTSTPYPRLIVIFFIVFLGILSQLDPPFENDF